MTVWKYANLALLAAVYICDPWQHERVEQVRFFMVPITGHTRIQRYHPEKITLGHKKETNGLLTSNRISPK